jgi:hypothetical protein
MRVFMYLHRIHVIYIGLGKGVSKKLKTISVVRNEVVKTNSFETAFHDLNGCFTGRIKETVRSSNCILAGSPGIGVSRRTSFKALLAKLINSINQLGRFSWREKVYQIKHSWIYGKNFQVHRFIRIGSIDMGQRKGLSHIAGSEHKMPPRGYGKHV